MITKTFTYEDFNGEKASQTFTFHMSKSDITKFRLRKDGSDFNETLSHIMKTNNARAILDVFEELVASAVGQKSEDGKKFIKNDEIRSDLFDTPAYDELFMKMLDDPDFAAKFIQSMLPTDMQKEIQQQGFDPKNQTREELEAKLRELEAKRDKE